MTKEELARKKGIQSKETAHTAAEALIITTKEAGNEIRETKESARVGRPKGKPSTKISLNIPDEYIEMISIAAGLNYNGNTSSYIVSLIENDIKANEKIYQQIKALKET